MDPFFVPEELFFGRCATYVSKVSLQGELEGFLRYFSRVNVQKINLWRLYREGGAQALKPKPKGRPKGSVRAVPPTREEELAERVRKLEAQVAYLKKSIALKAQKRSQTGTKP